MAVLAACASSGSKEGHAMSRLENLSRPFYFIRVRKFRASEDECLVPKCFLKLGFQNCSDISLVKY